MRAAAALALIVGLPSAFVVGVRAEQRYDIMTRINAVRAGDDYTEMARDMSDNDQLLHAGNRAVPCPAITERALVLVAIGQSNAANYVTRRHSSNPAAYAFYNGHCYASIDPLPGATGDRGSIWSRLADQVIASGKYDTVIVSVVAIADTSMAQWAPGGTLNPLIDNRLSQLREAGLRPAVILFQQGEHDVSRHTDPAAYQSNARRLLRQLKRYADRVYIAPTSACRSNSSPPIRDAQTRASFGSGAFLGVDMDTFTQRVNGCHLDGASADRIAAEWRELLTS